MKTALLHANIYNGKKDMILQKDQNIIIEDNKILSIGKDLPEDAKIIDLKGQYVIPGLINLHVHLPASGKPSQTSGNLPGLIKFLSSFYFGRKAMERMTQNGAKELLYSGVTTVRGVGGLIDCDRKVRDQINSGKIEGPRIYAANRAISVEGGHMAGSLATIAHNEQEAIQQVRKLADEGVDLIKLMITGGVLDADEEGTPGVLKMSPEIVKAACDEAHALGLEVAAHVESTQGVRVALENGVNTIEHGSFLNDELIQLFKEKHASLVTTISPTVSMLFPQEKSGLSDLYLRSGKIVMDGIIDAAKKAIESDIPLGLGTDTGCPYVKQYDTWRELNYFVKYLDVSPEFALYTATLSNAKILHIDDKIGSIEEGKEADIVVVKDDPCKDFSALKDISYVIKGGKIIEHPVIKRVKEYDELYDEVK